MTTIIFEPISGGATTTPAPPATGHGVLRLFGDAYGPTIAQLGGVGRGRLRLSQGSDATSPGPPALGLGAAVLRLAPGYSYGPGAYAPATGAATLRLRGGFASGAAGYESSAVGDAALRLIGVALGGAAIPPPPPPPFGDDVVFISDELLLDEGAKYHDTRILRALAGIGTTEFRAQWQGTRTLRSVVDLEVALAMVYRELIASAVEFGADATVDYTAIAHMADALLLGGAVTSLREAHALITEALVLHDLASTFDHVSLADTAALDAAMARSYTGFAAMVDEALIAGVQSGHLTLAASIGDTVAFDASALATLEGFASLRDQVDFVARALIDDEIYVAWSVNAELQAPTRYVNYPFNSFLRLPEGPGWRYYGLTDTGLYRLDGEDDAGTDIDAYLRLGLSTLGNRSLKQMTSAYLGYAGDGDLRLKVVTTDSVTGAREAHTYRLYQQGADSTREGRVSIGKGLKSVYMDFVLENIDGANFELDCIEIMALPIARRLRGNAGAKPQ